MPTLAEWNERLRALQAAEDAGDSSRAVELRRSLLSDRLHERIRGDSSVLTQVDMALLDAFAHDLQRLGFIEDALAVYGVARSYAKQRVDEYLVARFNLHGALCCIVLLDLDAARQVLARLFTGAAGSPLADAQPIIERADTLTFARATDRDLRGLRADALYTTARYWAATGPLGAAALALERALLRLGDQPSASLDPSEVAIFLAELRLDRGDHHAFVSLKEAWAERSPSPGTALKWQILESVRLFAEARYSEADKLLARLMKQRYPLGAERLLRWALWHRIHMLARLNRMDEAEALLEDLRRRDGWPQVDLAAMDGLLRARREGARLAFPLPPSAWEQLTDSEASVEPLAATLAQPPDEAREAGERAPGWHRTAERLREEYGRHANDVLLDLHRGLASDLTRARSRFAELKGWAEQVDSPLIAAHLQYLGALVSYYSTNYAAAESLALEAADRFLLLDMPAEERASCQVLSWIIRKSRREPEKTDALAPVRRREQKLLDRIHERLHPEDRILYDLNKWSAVDEEVLSICNELSAALAQIAASPPQRARSQKRPTISQAMRRIAALKNWPEPTEKLAASSPAKIAAPASTGASPLASEDIYTQVQVQQALRTQGLLEGPSAHFDPAWLPKDCAVLQYVVLPDRIVLFAAHQDGCTFFPLRYPGHDRGTSRVQLWHTLQRCLDCLYRAWKPYPKLTELPSLRQLAEMLGLPQVLSWLPRSVHHLYIVPDDVLFHAPFAAIPVDNQPLISRFTVSLSLTLGYSMQRPQALAVRDRGIGIAVTSSKVTGYADEQQTLDHARREIDSVAQSLRWPRWTSILDAEASRERVLLALAEAEVAHFACHGHFDAQAPHQSGLVLHDERLTISDLHGLRMRSLKAVVLVACWGANVKLLPGREAVGLPITLLRQGVAAVLASLWDINDGPGSVRFATELHKAARASGVSGGLAAIQRDAVASRPPFAWAGYVVYLQALPVTWWGALQLRILTSAQRLRRIFGARRKASREPSHLLVS